MGMMRTMKMMMMQSVLFVLFTAAAAAAAAVRETTTSSTSNLRISSSHLTSSKTDDVSDTLTTKIPTPSSPPPYFRRRPVDNETLIHLQWEAAVSDYWETSIRLRVADALKVYAPPAFIIVGWIGNSAILVILVRPRRQSSSLYGEPFAVYMVALLAVQLVRMTVAGAFNWIAFVVGWPYVAHWADWSCRLWQFAVAGVVTPAGALLANAMLGDRLAATYRRPGTDDRVDASRRLAAVAVVGAGFVGLVVIGVHSLWIYELRPEEPSVCGLDDGRDDLESVLWPWVTAVVLTYLPLVGVAVQGTVLAIRVACCCHGGGGGRSAAVPSTGGGGRSTPSGVEWSSSSSSSSSSFTRVTLFIAASHLIATVPGYVVRFVTDYRHSLPPPTQAITFADLEADCSFYVSSYLAETVCLIAECAHCAATFALYLGAVPALRRVLWTDLQDATSRCPEAMRCRRLTAMFDVRSPTAVDVGDSPEMEQTTFL